MTHTALPEEPDQVSIPLAALEHYGYCPRQAGLIHIDGYFESNVDTVRGDLAHATVDRAGAVQDRHGNTVWHRLPVWSDRLGLHGLCDTVEFHDGQPVPVEHKSGRYQPGSPADLQVAGQALCLREMFGAPVPVGVIYSGRTRRRHEVLVDAALIAKVEHAAAALRQIFTSGDMPAPHHDRRCARCSLRPGCEPAMPTITASQLFTPRTPDLVSEP